MTKEPLDDLVTLPPFMVILPAMLRVGSEVSKSKTPSVNVNEPLMSRAEAMAKEPEVPVLFKTVSNSASPLVVMVWVPCPSKVIVPLE
ncbi:MAG: hypothetical protein BWY19_00989 [bacterium ADurb.Bin212]|nr:MAG: hypothetical protein BWY19_00989 [bacterium ADurb.Bin212]